MKKALIPLLALTILASCHPEDRSGEQPFAPEVRTLDAEVSNTHALLSGCVIASRNSDVRKVGFVYGNDTLRLRVEQTENLQPLFRLATDSLGAGTYFYAAFATNGVGTTYADTLTFTLPME